MKPGENLSKSVVKAACVAGLFAVVIFTAVFATVFFYSRSKGSGEHESFEDFSFTEKLGVFDNLFGELFESGGELRDIEKWNTLIYSMEKSAVGSEAELSVLKRVRRLAGNYPEFMPVYTGASERAVRLYPNSAALCAIAGEALLCAEDSGPDTLIKYARVLQNSGPLGGKNFLPVAFAFYALSGALKDISGARSINNIEELFSAVIWGGGSGSAAVNIDAALLKILDDNIPEAESCLIPVKDELSGEKVNQNNRKLPEFFANYAYDFKDPVQAAEIWTKLGGVRDLACAADALYSVKNTAAARTLWKILTKDPSGYENLTVNDLEERQRIKIISLYNLASTSKINREKLRYLEELFGESGQENGDDGNTAQKTRETAGKAVLYGTVLYTRMLPDDRAIAVLGENPLLKTEPLLGLEKFRRSINSLPVERSLAETWLLLDNYPRSEIIYNWASWYFDFQGYFDDTDFLIKKARRTFPGDSPDGNFRLDFNEAVLQIREGNYDNARKILEEALKNEGIRDKWVFYANLGVIFKKARNFNRAYDYFVLARDSLLKNGDSGKKENRTNAALLYLNISECLNVFGRTGEARAAVLEAGNLDGENIKVRMALNRK